jgi:hypothetical protein
MDYSLCKKSEMDFCFHIERLVVGFNAVAARVTPNTPLSMQYLKTTFDKMKSMAALEICHALENHDFIGQADARVCHILDMMCDDKNTYAFEIVQDETLGVAYNEPSNMWHELAVYRWNTAENIRDMLKSFYLATADIDLRPVQQPKQSTAIVYQFPNGQKVQ